MCSNGDLCWILGIATVQTFSNFPCQFPVAQLVEHGASNAKIMGSVPRESKS